MNFTLFRTNDYWAVLQIYMSSGASTYVTFDRKDEFEVEFIYMIGLCLWDFLIFVRSGLRIKHNIKRAVLKGLY